jgi:EAL domain-containing protein (putative c-di-GMP-specific phosphodiesterase class I)/CheY-like chemotaxis protein
MSDSNLTDPWTARDPARTSLRKTEDPLGHAERMNAIGYLATGVVRDFNNALTVIQSHAWVLEETLDPGGVQRHHATEILRVVDRAAALTRQLLAVGPDSTVARRSLSVDAIVAGFVPQLNHVVGDGIAVVTHLGGVPAVTTDPRQLEQILMNLAVNARDAMSGRGQLTIETQLVEAEADGERAELGVPSPGGHVVLAVTDTGQGMDRETQAQIFEPRFTTKAAGTRTGLGLSIVHGIVTQSGGTISVHSEPGCGTTFRVHLPVASERLAAALGLAGPLAAPSLDPADACGPCNAGPAVHQPRVLVVDDDDQIRRVIARTLRKAELAVVDVDSGLKAIAQLEAGSFDVILSDVHMPDGDGLELLRAVRRIDLDVPVVLMSGAPDVATAAAAVEYGAFRYLTKPVDRNLVKTIRHAARAHEFARLRRDAFSAMGSHAGAVDRVGLEVRFEQALEQLWMALQPIFDARTGARFGVEALVRSGEPSMPGAQHILDAATQLGLLPRLGRRVRALSAAVLAGRSDDLTLFVNLHPEDLADIDLVTDDAPLTKIAPRVILEITERTSLTSSPELEARLARLRKLGFRIAVDDIGAGYSGLSSFTDLMPEVVKIDMSLVRDVHANPRKQRTIAALCRLCHEEPGCLVVGEGVETVEEQRCLIDLGCDLLQGYLLGRPSREL